MPGSELLSSPTPPIHDSIAAADRSCRTLGGRKKIHGGIGPPLGLEDGSLKRQTAKTLLFLCTGNYYRSRFAEILFNDVAERTGLAWRACSRGLAIELGVNNVGPISAVVAERLTDLGIATYGYLRMPMQVRRDDLERADHIVALKEDEHRPLLTARHPAWQDRVEYWHVHDLDFAPVEKALREIERRIPALAARLAGGGR
jgi:protein-tyrosine phosphatase